VLVNTNDQCDGFSDAYVAAAVTSRHSLYSGHLLKGTSGHKKRSYVHCIVKWQTQNTQVKRK